MRTCKKTTIQVPKSKQVLKDILEKVTSKYIRSTKRLLVLRSLAFMLLNRYGRRIYPLSQLLACHTFRNHLKILIITNLCHF